MNPHNGNRRQLFAALATAGLSGVPPTVIARTTVINPPTGNPLADKLAAMAADKSKNKPKGTLELEFDPTRKTDLIFSIPIEDVLKACGPSSTGTSNGLTLQAEGKFPFTLGNKTYEFSLQMRGGWATVKAIA